MSDRPVSEIRIHSRSQDSGEDWIGNPEINAVDSGFVLPSGARPSGRKHPPKRDHVLVNCAADRLGFADTKYHDLAHLFDHLSLFVR